MKISKVEYENFRNFKEHGEIICSLDGKVTIIYGRNGDGKTTFHQLFQWIIYGKVHFNKTTSDKRLYNLTYENHAEYGSTFEVMGRIDFEHMSEQYSLTRNATYKKGLTDSEKTGEDLSLNKMDNDSNWKRLERPEEVIEKMLPSGLAEYFFFDGESMIADLSVKGKDSAAKLRHALFSMFDLDILEYAKDHIGRTDLKTTVLGKLFIDKGGKVSVGESATIKQNINNVGNEIAGLDAKTEAKKEEKKSLKDLVNKISEDIGTSKSKSEYEKERKNLQNNRDIFLNNAVSCQQDYGRAVMNMFPQLFISKAILDAKEKIHLKIEDNKIPKGISKSLIKYLLLDSTSECICGSPLCEKQLKRIEGYLELLPPNNYTVLYNQFSSTAKAWGNGYDIDSIEGYIKRALQNNDCAAASDKRIKVLDEEKKKSLDIEKLVIDRQKAEEKIKEIDIFLEKAKSKRDKYQIYLEKQMSEYDKVTKETENGIKAQNKIDIMEEVYKHFEQKLEHAAHDYSMELQNNIQGLLDEMMGSKRQVSVSNSFAVRVTDSYDDESKSEGQFAMVSFAYIGGILKMLQSKENLSTKEYPLVLDGPFSKLDPDKMQSVVNCLPKFAPQVILFSKDDLNDVFDDSQIGRVWTIESNEEQNVAVVKEGHLWI